MVRFSTGEKMMTGTQADPGSWVLARGYRFTGLHCGIRAEVGRKDLAVVLSDVPATAAGVFTQNRVRAAPVRVCQERLPAGDVRGVVVCSGNANACTGPQGLADAHRMTAVAAEVAGCRAEQFLVASTGVIGRHLPMPQVEAGIRSAVPQAIATAGGLSDLAHAILTTDTVIKVTTRELELNGTTVRLTGVAKGAAMIGPNMATMLAFVFTDAKIAPDDLAPLIGRAASGSFNCVSVEGHTSTNDTLLVLANGRAGGPPLAGEALGRFGAALTAVCGDLARAIAADAEGANHLVTIEVEGTRDDSEAFRIAKAIGDSPLVKTAIFGADPNWGRFVSAAGYAGVPFEEEQLSLWLGDMLLYHHGVPQPFDAATASAYLKRERNTQMRLRFTLGSGRCTFWTCDLTYEYIKLNADYTT
ncbi:MAG: bifunctional glutamate N-acetyltransferase/amino-acid acetyltransferase ArgJ [Gemmataceae bacterium]